jgi:hypothetical protein
MFLIQCIRYIGFLFFISLLHSFFQFALANDSTAVSGTAIVRSQLQSIAKEIVEQAKFDSTNIVLLTVKGEDPKELAENAFLLALQNRHIKCALKEPVVNGQALSIYLIDVSTKIRTIGQKKDERTIASTVEARATTGSEYATRVLGLFTRASTDTVHEFSSVLYSESAGSKDEGVLQRIVTPFIIIGSAVVIVYLLFTVRS